MSTSGTSKRGAHVEQSGSDRWRGRFGDGYGGRSDTWFNLVLLLIPKALNTSQVLKKEVFLIITFVASFATAADRDEWYMEYKPSQHIAFTQWLNWSSPDGHVSEYIVFAPIAPELVEQNWCPRQDLREKTKHVFPVRGPQP